MLYENAFNKHAFGDVMNYHYEKEIPLKLIYNDGTEQVVNIISFDRYTLICEEVESQESFVAYKHSVKKIETKVDLKEVFNEIRKSEE